jgi:hypothetical protein
MPSISEIARSIQIKAREVADRVTHPNRKYRHTREQAATIISEAINAPYSEETLRKNGCPYLSVAGHVLYSDDDLIELATDILARAQRRGSTPKPRIDRPPAPSPRQWQTQRKQGPPRRPIEANPTP